MRFAANVERIKEILNILQHYLTREQRNERGEGRATATKKKKKILPALCVCVWVWAVSKEFLNTILLARVPLLSAHNLHAFVNRQCTRSKTLKHRERCCHCHHHRHCRVPPQLEVSENALNKLFSIFFLFCFIFASPFLPRFCFINRIILFDSHDSASLHSSLIIVIVFSMLQFGLLLFLLHLFFFFFYLSLSERLCVVFISIAAFCVMWPQILVSNELNSRCQMTNWAKRNAWITCEIYMFFSCVDTRQIWCGRTCTIWRHIHTSMTAQTYEIIYL